jgi:DNA-directed RNA polymerase subunit RPC12/RpoP
MPDENAISFKCQHCGQPIEVPTEMLGTTTKCPSCGEIVKVQPIELREPVLIRFVYFGLCLIALCVICSSARFPFGLLLGGLVTTAHTQHPAQAKIPITGAFNFTLGEKLPEGLDLKDGYCFVMDYTNTPPFDRVQLGCLLDRTIYTITGYGWSNTEEVVKALQFKYGEGSFYHDATSERYAWVNGQCRLTAEKFGEGLKDIRVTYENKTLMGRSFDESEKASHAVATNLAPKL